MRLESTAMRVRRPETQEDPLSQSYISSPVSFPTLFIFSLTPRPVYLLLATRDPVLSPPLFAHVSWPLWHWGKYKGKRFHRGYSSDD